jgi:S1-C subfamily serine protease
VAGDITTALNGKAADSVARLIARIENCRVGDTLH